MERNSIVVCSTCGRPFDLSAQGGYYMRVSKRYMCRSCWNARDQYVRQPVQNRAVNYGPGNLYAQVRQSGYQRTVQGGLGQSTGAMIAKLAFGGLFFWTGVSLLFEDGNFPSFMVSMVIAAALIAWAVIPIITARKNRQTQQRTMEAQMPKPEQLVWECASCGATAHGMHCEYCGSVPPKDAVFFVDQ